MVNKRRKRHRPEQMVGKLRDTDAMLNDGKDLVANLTLDIKVLKYISEGN